MTISRTNMQQQIEKSGKKKQKIITKRKARRHNSNKGKIWRLAELHI